MLHRIKLLPKEFIDTSHKSVHIAITKSAIGFFSTVTKPITTFGVAPGAVRFYSIKFIH